jgi:signal peptide peptidase SppA
LAAAPGGRPPSAHPTAVGRVAVVPVVGVLTKGWTAWGGGTAELRRDIRRLAADPHTSAVLLAVDSPGGTVAGTADLAAEVRAAAKQKPVWAHVDDLCASAAYWVACQAEKVYANSNTALIGSIGTFLTVYDQSAAFEKRGVKALHFATGPLKGAGTPGTPITDGQSAYYRSIVDAGQASFDAAVRAGRRMSHGSLARVRTGGVFPAPEAERLGLIDGIQSFDKTLSDLQQAAARR